MPYNQYPGILKNYSKSGLMSESRGQPYWHKLGHPGMNKSLLAFELQHTDQFRIAVISAQTPLEGFYEDADTSSLGLRRENIALGSI